MIKLNNESGNSSNTRTRLVPLVVVEVLSSPLVLSFVGGLLSSSLVWYSMGWRLPLSSSSSDHEDDVDDDDDNKNNNKKNQDDDDIYSQQRVDIPSPEGDLNTQTSPNTNTGSQQQRRSLMDNLLLKYTYSSMDDIKHRIGELPSLQRRSHWPWDRLRQRRRQPQQQQRTFQEASSVVDEAITEREKHNGRRIASDDDDEEVADIIQTNNNNNNNKEQLHDESLDNKKNGMDSTRTAAATAAVPPPQTTTSPSPSSSPIMTHKSDYCIGSIFGLDVGGTLAKLVYFEQKSKNACGGGATAAAADMASVVRVGSLRERTYRTAASAQAVLMARRRGGLMHRRQRSRSFTDDDDDGAFHRGERLRRHSVPEVHLHSHTHAHAQHTHAQHNARHSLHTIQSNQDLEELNLWRQESVPDDLHIYAETVHTKIRLSEDDDEEEPSNSSSSSSSNNKNKNGLFRSKEAPHNNNNNADATTTTQTSTRIRKARSMLDISQYSWHRAEALDRFYNFARRLDSYREGLKDDKLSFYSRELGGEFHFIHFETRRMQQAMDLIRTNDLHLNIHEMGATGGGAHKFASQWKHDLGIAMRKQDELDSLVAGMQFVLSTVVGECYTFRPAKEATTQKKTTEKLSSFGSAATNSSSADSYLSSSSNLNNTDDDAVGAPLTDEAFEVESTDGFYPDDIFDDDDDEEEEDKKDDGEKGEKRRQKDRGSGDEWWWSRKVQRDAVTDAGTFPYLLVTIGTGVSILRVDGPRKFERISGSTIGGGTYWGLIRLLTDVEDFEDVMRLAAKGDPSKVDMLVGDIYGENSDALEKIGLPANLVASSFGKLVAKEDPAAGLKQEDLARALLLMITNNIGQVAYLNAKLAKTRRIYFVGNFLRQNKISQRRIAWAIDYWSKGEMEALFLEHEGYFGALGAFLLNQEIGKENESDQPHSPWGLRRAYSSFGGSDSAGTSDPAEKRPPHRRNTTLS